MAAVDVHDTFLSLKLHDVKDPKFSLPYVACSSSFMVESCGEIFKVSRFHLGVSAKIILTLEVFKLDLSKMDWVKVESLGDRVFLLGESCTSLSSTELGVKGNCIYFTFRGCTRLFKFDMDDGTITITLPCGRKIQLLGRTVLGGAKLRTTGLWYCFQGISFSAPPTSPDCIVFGHTRSNGKYVNVSVYHTGEDDWWEYCIVNEVPIEFLTANCNPVFWDGVFYCLGKDGKLGCFHSKEEDVYEWRVLPVPAIISWSPSMLYSVLQSSEWQFLVEYNGEILSVSVGFVGQHVRVYKLDQSKMRWVGVTSLGDKVLFLSHIASILVPAGLKGKENTIYFPRFHGKDNVFYSLSSGNYHCFGSKHSRQDWIDTSGNLESTWIQCKK
ncbi:hypothetical protein IFM89_028799 [Coptis chinensis]|uniref:KIB1-4 beta-propeller domain-containing protein n=1 Tax=Coptis chinensis TaxID=261450 RepID=A0A835H005_9MAGN|nr:hypothetical protein IFM89_028799 [Coptis chinensis]